MTAIGLLILAVVLALGALLLYRAHKRGCKRSRYVEEQRRQSQKLLADERKRWHKTFDWHAPGYKQQCSIHSSDKLQPEHR